MPFRSFGALELGIIALIVVMVFGAGKLSEVGGALGKGIRKFRRGMSNEGDRDEPRDSARPGTEAQEASTEERAKVKGG